MKNFFSMKPDIREGNMKKLLVIGLIIAATCSISFPLDASGLFMGGLFGSGFNLSALLHPFSQDSKSSKDDNAIGKDGKMMAKGDKMQGDKAKDDKVIERTFKTAQGKMLEMDLSMGGKIKISGWNKDELYAKVTKAGRDDEYCKVNFEENSDGIKITSEYEGEEKNEFNTDMTYEIKVPAKFNLKFDTMGGDIYINGVEGRMTGETKGGLVSLNKLKGDLDLRTMGGNIDLRDSDVDGSVTTMGGRVVIDNVKGDVKGSSMGGNVSYTNVTRRNGNEMSKEVNISSMGGEINVDNAPNGANVSTMGGNIKVGSVKQYIKAKTMGGNIEISEADGSVEATTMGGSVDVKVLGNANSTDHDVKLTSMSGDVTLYVPSDFSMDVNIKAVIPENGGSGEKRIISDFDLKMQEKESENGWSSNHGHRNHGKRLEANGSFNGGKNHIEIVTMNGKVYLKKI